MLVYENDAWKSNFFKNLNSIAQLFILLSYFQLVSTQVSLLQGRQSCFGCLLYIALTFFETERGVIPTKSVDSALIKSHLIFLKLAEFLKDAQNQCPTTLKKIMKICQRLKWMVSKNIGPIVQHNFVFSLVKCAALVCTRMS